MLVILFMCLLCQEAAQDVIGVIQWRLQPKPQTLLEKLRVRGYVDIFDAGPKPLKPEQKVFTHYHKKQARFGLWTEKSQKGAMHLISAGQLDSFRVSSGTQSHKVPVFSLRKSYTRKLAIQQAPPSMGRSVNNKLTRDFLHFNRYAHERQSKVLAP